MKSVNSKISKLMDAEYTHLVNRKLYEELRNFYTTDFYKLPSVNIGDIVTLQIILYGNR